MEPVTLEGQHARLEPLGEEHWFGLSAIGLEPELWQWTTMRVANAGEMREYIGAALRGQAAGTMLPFAVIEKATGKVVGSTRYMNIETAHKRVEIGSTWYGVPWQRTAINTECKLLLLQHAFEQLGCIRVELRTDRFNERSQAAIARIGGTREGVLRQHMIVPGRLRDTVVFSILDHEWPRVKTNLLARL